jgi:hypothetical protein
MACVSDLGCNACWGLIVCPAMIYDLVLIVGGNGNTVDEDAKVSSKSKSKQKRRRPGYVLFLCDSYLQVLFIYSGG